MRTFGARDRVHRKKRADKGKRRTLYRKRPVKKKRKFQGKLVYYQPKRNPGDPYKLYFWDIQRMSLDGLHHFSKETRNYMTRNVYGKNRVRIDAYPEEIDCRENLEKFCAETLWEGHWLILLWTRRRNRFMCSPRAVGSVVVRETSEGKKARVTPSYKNRSIARYSFWHKS